MDTADRNILADQATATAALVKVRDDLIKATENATTTMVALRDGIVRVRPTGALTVAEMAEAIGRDRNYVDSVWSAYGDTTKGKQTRVAVVEQDDDSLPEEYRRLSELAHNQRGTATTVGVLRAERDRVIVMVYASKLMGPSAIASAVGVDRNHVLRVCRKAGVEPLHRVGTRNQHTVSK